MSFSRGRAVSRRARSRRLVFRDRSTELIISPSAISCPQHAPLSVGRQRRRRSAPSMAPCFTSSPHQRHSAIRLQTSSQGLMPPPRQPRPCDHPASRRHVRFCLRRVLVIGRSAASLTRQKPQFPAMRPLRRLEHRSQRSAFDFRRLTPRCSGQHPGVRPGVAAELILR